MLCWLGVCLSQLNCHVISSTPALPLRPGLSVRWTCQLPLLLTHTHIHTLVLPEAALSGSIVDSSRYTKRAVWDETGKRIKALCVAFMDTCRQIHTSIHRKSQQELLVQAEGSQGNLSTSCSLLILYSKHTHIVFHSSLLFFLLLSLLISLWFCYPFVPLKGTAQQFGKCIYLKPGGD